MTTTVPAASGIEPAKVPNPRQFIRRLVALHDNHQGAGQVAALRFALIPATDIQARAYTEPIAVRLPDAHRVGFLRTVGIVASHPRAFTAHGDGPGNTVGAAIAELHRRTFNTGPAFDIKEAATHNQITAQVQSLPSLPLEAAVVVLNNLISRCAGYGIRVNPYNLCDLLTRWGNGITTESADTRKQVVIDFYSA